MAIKSYLIKQGIPITNAIRIINNKVPLPLIRLIITDSSLVSKLITNGITICLTRCGVTDSISNGRPFPCRTCLQYHAGRKCQNDPSCYKCGHNHPSSTCNNTPNKNLWGTCKKQAYRTAASNCPLRPFTGKQDTPTKIYISQNNIQNNTTTANLSSKTYQTPIKELINTHILEKLLQDNLQEQTNKILFCTLNDAATKHIWQTTVSSQLGC